MRKQKGIVLKGNSKECSDNPEKLVEKGEKVAAILEDPHTEED